MLRGGLADSARGARDEHHLAFRRKPGAGDDATHGADARREEVWGAGDDAMCAEMEWPKTRY